jgi:hypothetical protein
MADAEEIRRLRQNARLRAERAVHRERLAREERKRRDKLKRRMIEYLGGACVRCRRTLKDFDDHVAAFDFHHRDPSAKRFHFAGNYKRAWEALRQELDQCDLACACCHRIIEATRADTGRRRGRPPLPWPDGGSLTHSGRDHSLAERIAREALRRTRDRAAAPGHQLTLFEGAAA